MKHIRTFESYKIQKLPEYSSKMYYELPDFIKDGQLFEYFDLTIINEFYPNDEYEDDSFKHKIKYKDKDKKDWIDIDYCDYRRDNILKAKELKKDIIEYINDFYNMEESKHYNIHYDIYDFDFYWNKISNNNRKEYTATLIGLKVTNYSGSHKVTGEEFEELSKFLSDPELYLNTKKYNL